MGCGASSTKDAPVGDPAPVSVIKLSPEVYYNNEPIDVDDPTALAPCDLCAGAADPAAADAHLVKVVTNEVAVSSEEADAVVVEQAQDDTDDGVEHSESVDLIALQRAQQEAAEALGGSGVWEASTEADSTSTSGWEVVANNEKLDCHLWAFNFAEGPRRVVVNHGIGDCPSSSVDFKLLTVLARLHDRNLVLPLRRLNTNGEQTHPPADERHPWYTKRIEIKEASGGENDWLSNEFFLKAFKQAVSCGGGKIQHDVDDLFDFRFNEDFRNVEEADARISRRGGVLYREPFGWKRFAIKCKDKFDDGDDTWMGLNGDEGEWAVAYHGAPMHVVPLVVRDGFVSGAGQGGRKSVDVRTGAVVGEGVYCTPNYRVVDCYATKSPAVMLDSRTLYFAFQCRVLPEAIRRPDRTFARNCDEEVMGVDGAFEWIINDPKHIRPYGVLVREDLAVKGMKTLTELVTHQAWNRAHLPFPRGTFDHIPGRRTDPEELEHSYKQAEKAFGVKL
eukprot:TRINITY_DN75257_c0_g1_i1.p1 TRINITY_DN75257_c0_g1~~TRINITY_DN75257_c0_g1_i1.p1  ORF type:complete len:504 (+),score=65.30 TRINITY_DN75257_c0_g1_i1:99-1610(+)